MKFRALLPLSFAAVLGLAALSTGSPLLLMVSILILISMLIGFCSVLWASGTIRVSASLDNATVCRGDSVTMQIQILHHGLIPVAPIVLQLVSSSFESERRDIFLRDMPGKHQSLSYSFRARHAGAFQTGVRSCRVEDLLGFFYSVKTFDSALNELLVLPSVFPTEPLVLSPGDPGSDTVSRATEDLSSPSDIRSYQSGDPMKKIHWKLSLRKHDLLVRKFDEPVQQDVLVLMDCSPPPSWGHPRAEADIRDALIETAASVFKDQELNDLSVHLPLFGTHPAELEKSMGLPLVFENLARADFSESDRFERVLTLESRRLRKVGCLVVISARLNSNMVDVLTRMRQLGPYIRFYLITFAPEDMVMLPLISRLQQSGIGVSYVKPDQSVL